MMFFLYLFLTLGSAFSNATQSSTQTSTRLYIVPQQEFHCPLTFTKSEKASTDVNKPQLKWAKREIANGNEHADVFWINENGEYISMGHLRPFEAMTLDTVIGDRFIVRSVEGSQRLLLDLIVGELNLSVETQKADPASYHSKLINLATSRDFLNDNVFSVEFSFKLANGTRHVLLDDMPPRGRASTKTFVGHHFEFRRKGDLSGEWNKIAVTPIEIQACQLDSTLNNESNLELNETSVGQQPTPISRPVPGPYTSSLGVCDGKVIYDESSQDAAKGSSIIKQLW